MTLISHPHINFKIRILTHTAMENGSVAVTNCFHKYNTGENVPHLNFFVNLVESNVPIVDTLYGATFTVHFGTLSSTVYGHKSIQLSIGHVSYSTMRSNKILGKSIINDLFCFNTFNETVIWACNSIRFDLYLNIMFVDHVLVLKDL